MATMLTCEVATIQTCEVATMQTCEVVTMQTCEVKNKTSAIYFCLCSYEVQLP